MNDPALWFWLGFLALLFLWGIQVGGKVEKTFLNFLISLLVSSLSVGGTIFFFNANPHIPFLITVLVVLIFSSMFFVGMTLRISWKAIVEFVGAII